ncbi:unnamed protein product, partial [Sphagnum jensenii]
MGPIKRKSDAGALRGKRRAENEKNIQHRGRKTTRGLGVIIVVASCCCRRNKGEDYSSSSFFFCPVLLHFLRHICTYEYPDYSLV